MLNEYYASYHMHDVTLYKCIMVCIRYTSYLTCDKCISGLYHVKKLPVINGYQYCIRNM